jgi:hypothetical protein
VVWLDLCRPTAADFDMINTEFGLHELAVEDALQESQRPKFDRYATHPFISVYALTRDARGARLDTSGIAIFLTDHALITVRKDDGFDIAPVPTVRAPDHPDRRVGVLARRLADSQGLQALTHHSRHVRYQHPARQPRLHPLWAEHVTVEDTAGPSKARPLSAQADGPPTLSVPSGST